MCPQTGYSSMGFEGLPQSGIDWPGLKLFMISSKPALSLIRGYLRHPPWPGLKLFMISSKPALSLIRGYLRHPPLTGGHPSYALCVPLQQRKDRLVDGILNQFSRAPIHTVYR